MKFLYVPWRSKYVKNSRDTKKENAIEDECIFCRQLTPNENIKKFILLLSFCSFLLIYPNDQLKSELFDRIQNNAPFWMSEQIKRDLEYFSNGISQEMINQTINCHGLLVRYQIINNKVSIKEKSKFIIYYPEIFLNFLNAREAVTTTFLEELCSYIKLPDIDFIFDCGDGFRGESEHCGYSAPIFAISKNKNFDKKIVLMPDLEVLKDHQYFIDEALNGSKNYPYESKMEKAFWRGSTTGGANFTLNNYMNFPRFKLVSLAKNNSEFIDAKFTNLAQMTADLKKKLHEIDYVDKHINIADHLKYKYQIVIDGNTCTFGRLYWQLFSNSVIFKQESDNIQWFYDCIKPYKHYIPFKNDCSDLIEKIQWAKKYDDEVRKIIINANNFANNHHKYIDMLHYMYLLLIEYSKLQKFSL